MFDEVKRVQLEQLSQFRTQVLAQKSMVSQPLHDAEKQLWDLEYQRARGIVGKKHFTFWEKSFSARKDYKNFRQQQQHLATLPDEIKHKKNEINVIEQDVNQALVDAGIEQSLSQIEQAIANVKAAQTYEELNLTPDGAAQMLADKGIAPVLNDSDRFIVERPHDYTTTANLMLIHKTDLLPTDNLLRSDQDAQIPQTNSVVLDGQEYQYDYAAPRSTVHFALNDETSSAAHESGQDRYAVLMPFDDLPKEQIGGASTMDTFARGSVQLSARSYLLCPQDEVERAQNLNPQVAVLGYTGENVQDYARAFSTQIGYPAERSKVLGCWDDYESVNQFNQLMNREGIKVANFGDTYFAEDEAVVGSINQAVGLAKLLRDRHLLNSVGDMERLLPQLTAQKQGFGEILGNLFGASKCQNDLGPEAIKGNGRQVELLFQKMEQADLSFAPIYQDILRQRFDRSVNRPAAEYDHAFGSPAEQIIYDSLQFAPFDTVISTAISDAVIHANTLMQQNQYAYENSQENIQENAYENALEEYTENILQNAPDLER